MNIHFKVNGARVEIEVDPDEMLLEVLRRDLDLRSVRATCGVGVCGACTALIDGEPISTCIYLAPLADGCEITTVEGLGSDHPVQQAFEEEHAFQCGYCTPGMILTVKALLEENPHPSDEEIKVALGGNLCRCGCYVKIINAVKRAAASRSLQPDEHAVRTIPFSPPETKSSCDSSVGGLDTGSPASFLAGYQERPCP